MDADMPMSENIRVTSTRRPPAVQSSNMQLPVIQETADYIMITQDILDAFRERIATSNTVTLKLNTMRYRDHGTSPHRSPGRNFSDRLRQLHGKSGTDLDLKPETQPRRPVRVFVDDVTKMFEQKAAERLDTGRHSRDGRKSKRSNQASASDVAGKRSMDSGDEGNDPPDDIIEAVARVNSVPTEHAPILPEIRAAPCQIHTKQAGNGKVGQDGGQSKDGRSPRRVVPLPVKNVGFHCNTSQNNNSASKDRLDINVRIPEQFPSALKVKAPLPKNMSSKDYVMTWLIHGSDPQGSNHFPEIVPNGKTKEIIPNNGKTKAKRTPRNGDISE